MEATGKDTSATGRHPPDDRKIFRVMRQSNKLRNPRRLRRANTRAGQPASPDWTLHEQALLGKMPDVEAAKRLGRTLVAVRLRRSRLGIPEYGQPARRHHSWTSEELALLGTMPDRLVARELRRTLIAVTGRRGKLGIPAKIEGYHRWRPEDDALLGHRRDEDIARLLGITVLAVQRRRNALKIYLRPPTPRCFHPTPARSAPAWTPEEDALLGTASDAEIARRLKCANTTVALRRTKLKIPAFVPNWTPKEDALLKQFNEREVAGRIGRSIAAVKRRRKKLGLPQIDPPFVWWKREEDRLLGTAPDAEVARRLGRSESSVKGRRLLLGIKFPNPRRPWPPGELALLGTLPDAVLAKYFNRPESAVSSKRLQLRTVKELMEGQGIERPSTVAATDEIFKEAPESKKKQHEQKALEL